MCQNMSGASTAVKLNNLQTTVKALAKTVKEALPRPENMSKQIQAAVAAKSVQGTSKGVAYVLKIVILEH